MNWESSGLELMYYPTVPLSSIEMMMKWIPNRFCFESVQLKTTSNTPLWVFSTFFKLHKWYQIAQSKTYIQGKRQDFAIKLKKEKNRRKNEKNHYRRNLCILKEFLLLFYIKPDKSLENAVNRSKLYRWNFLLQYFFCCYFVIFQLNINNFRVLHNLPAQSNNSNTRTRCEICSKLKIKIPERRQWRRSGIFIVNFEHISYLVLVFPLLTLNMQLPAGRSAACIPAYLILWIYASFYVNPLLHL